MPPFKDELGAAPATKLAKEFAAAWPAFPTRRFLRGLADALEPLELMERNRLLAARLADALPSRFDAAADAVWAALASPSFDGWITLPVGTFVADAGIDAPNTALPLLAGLTPRFSSEGPIRPFIERHPSLTYDYLHRWCADDDEHVRRLVSEGTRPRLPWAPLLRGLIADPSPNVPLLEALIDDGSAYVRRSVANHLNDISKDHPDRTLSLARQWIGRGAGPAWVVRHGLRTLVKRGDPAALELLGSAVDAEVRLLDLALEREQIAIGDAAVFTFTVVLDSAESCDAVIDYRVHYVGARGSKAPKVFKLTRRRLSPGEPVSITRRHAFEHVSIRQIRPGPHTIDVQVNGRVLGSVTVEVT